MNNFLFSRLEKYEFVLLISDRCLIDEVERMSLRSKRSEVLHQVLE
jgi:hypothetical protein